MGDYEVRRAVTEVRNRLAKYFGSEEEAEEASGELEKICARDGCIKPVPKGKKKYCSSECAKYMNRRWAAARSRERYLAAAASVRRAKTGLRACLSCARSFLSEGPWNRICPQCAERNDLISSRAEESTKDYSP